MDIKNCLYYKAKGFVEKTAKEKILLENQIKDGRDLPLELLERLVERRTVPGTIGTG